MWELACLRCGRCGVSDVRCRCYRGQARLPHWVCVQSGIWGVGQLCL